MISKTAFLLLLSISLSVSAQKATAGTVELNRAIYQAIPFDLTSPNVDKRLAFAEAIEAYWADLDQKVPRLSPREVEWLEGELDNTDGARLNKALNSPEYGVYMVAQKIDLCLENVNGVIESISVPERNEVEMFFWLKMINCYDGSNDIFRYLEQANIPVTSDAFYEGTDKIYAGWTNIEQGIIVNKVAVRAMGDAMGWTIAKD